MEDNDDDREESSTVLFARRDDAHLRFKAGTLVDFQTDWVLPIIPPLILHSS